MYLWQYESFFNVIHHILHVLSLPLTCCSMISLISSYFINFTSIRIAGYSFKHKTSPELPRTMAPITMEISGRKPAVVGQSATKLPWHALPRRYNGRTCWKQCEFGNWMIGGTLGIQQFGCIVWKTGPWSHLLSTNPSKNSVLSWVNHGFCMCHSFVPAMSTWSSSSFYMARMEPQHSQSHTLMMLWLSTACSLTTAWPTVSQFYCWDLFLQWFLIDS